MARVKPRSVLQQLSVATGLPTSSVLLLLLVSGTVLATTLLLKRPAGLHAPASGGAGAGAASAVGGRRSIVDSGSDRGGDGSSAALSAYVRQAEANMTRFRQQLLPSLLHNMGWNNSVWHWRHLPPPISCPPAWPMQRYGTSRPAPGSGQAGRLFVDGSKVLCDVRRSTTPAAAASAGTGGAAAAADKGGDRGKSSAGSSSGGGGGGGRCLIYSMGSNGDFEFERMMLAATECELHTFDCTYAGSSLGARHTYHRTCIGESGRPGPRNTGPLKSWAQVTGELRHEAVDLLKIDIEGAEYPVLASWTADDPTLPRQLSIEFHMGPQFPNMTHPQSPASLALVFLHLADLGYGSFFWEPNEFDSACCAEYTFIRYTHLPPDAASSSSSSSGAVAAAAGRAAAGLGSGSAAATAARRRLS